MARKTSKTELQKLEKQKTVLLKRRENLVNNLSYRSDQGKKTEKKGDSSDLASNSRDEELNFLIGDRERQELKDIDNALERFDEGTYGLCEECNSRISFKRLEALPFAKYCLDCQSNAETTNKQATGNKPERYVNLFSDVIKFANLETDDEDDSASTTVNEFTGDGVGTTDLESEDIEDLQEDEEDEDKD